MQYFVYVLQQNIVTPLPKRMRGSPDQSSESVALSSTSSQHDSEVIVAESHFGAPEVSVSSL